MRPFRTFFAALFLLYCLPLPASGPLWKPAPGHQDTPVIFWAHYMPQVAWGFLHAGGHVGGNADVWPFSTQSGTPEEQMVHAMKEALESGINGFQFLTSVPSEAWTAAERVRKETGRTFYIAPEWCDVGPDPKRAAKLIGDFVERHKESPFLYRRDGKQVHFTYNHGKWSGSNGDHDSSGVPYVRELLKQRGIEVVLVPTIGDWPKTLLDLPQWRYRSFPPFQTVRPGELRYLAETNWDGCTGLNGGANVRAGHVGEIVRRLAAPQSKPFFLVPSMRTMYDSSNRYWQAIHCRGLGLRVLRRDLRLWLGAGFRQLTFSTWNDVNETMLLPSSRNVWGLNDLIAFYRSLAEYGTTPFEEPRFVVSYEPEVLMGDQGYFQFLALPGKAGRSADYTLTVSLRDPSGREIHSFGLLNQLDGAAEDALAENRFETADWPAGGLVVTPYLTLYERDKLSGESRMLYEELRLAPIRIRYNQIHYFTPYTVSLAHVNPAARLELAWEGGKSPERPSPAGTLENLRLRTSGDARFRRVNLAESCLGLGAFRADDTAAKPPHLFLRLAADPAIRGTLTVDGGKALSAYQPHWRLSDHYFEFGEPSAEFNIPNAYRSLPVTVRLEAPPQNRIRLRLAGMTTEAYDGSISDLIRQPLRREFTVAGKPVTLDLRLTTDATDVNCDYPVAPGAELVRPLPLAAGHEAVRVFHTWALDEQQRVSYSNPVVWSNSERSAAPRPVRFLRTYGVFDDFVNDSSSAAANPFTVRNIVQRQLPANRIEYHLIDFDEGCGREVNHNGTSHQLGRGWIEGEYRWIPEGFRGGALQLGRDGKLKLRSKTMPHGALTVSLRVRFDEKNPAGRALLEDGDNYQLKLSGPLSLRLDREGRIVAERPASGPGARVRSASPLRQGWNHIAVTYDLETLTLYLNGKPEASQPAPPSYSRTHSTPVLGATWLAGPETSGNRFGGVIDQLEIIGTSLDSNEIRQLYEQGNCDL